MKIRLKDKSDIKVMQACGEILSSTLAYAKSVATPGMTTKELNRLAEEYIEKNKGAKPAFKGYNGFPAALCTSVNDQVVHGVPSDYELKEGDIVGIDCGVYYQGFYTDSAITVGIGNISDKARKLMEVTEKSLNLAISEIANGVNLKKIASTIEDYVTKHGYSVVRELVGHGIGRNLHEDPQIPNFVPPYPLPKIKNGMTFCIEPMINIGQPEVIVDKDGSTIKTADGSLSAHFEKTIALFDDHVIIVTPYY